MIEVKIRPFDAEQDSGFLYSTMPKGVYFGSSSRQTYYRNDFFIHFQKYMKELLTHAKVSVACMQDDPRIILGYSVFADTILHFVYVKELFRKQGIATLLLKNQPISAICEKNLTKIGVDILRANPKLSYVLEEKKLEEKNPQERENNHAQRQSTPQTY